MVALTGDDDYDGSNDVMTVMMVMFVVIVDDVKSNNMVSNMISLQCC